MTDAVDKALQELAVVAAGTWSNRVIVDGINAVRVLRKAEIAAARAEAAHALAMRAEACSVMGVTPGTLVGLPTARFQPDPA